LYRIVLDYSFIKRFSQHRRFRSARYSVEKWFKIKAKNYLTISQFI